MTCISDALVLGPFPVTPPGGLQGQSCNTISVRGNMSESNAPQLLHYQTILKKPFRAEICMNLKRPTLITYQCLAFLLRGHPQCWREFWGSKWRSWTCREKTCWNTLCQAPSTHPLNIHSPSQFVLLRLVAQVVDQSRDAVRKVAAPVWPSVRAERFIPEIRWADFLTKGRQSTDKAKRFYLRQLTFHRQGASPLQEGFKASSVGEAGSPHPQVFHETEVLYLVSDQNFIECTCRGNFCFFICFFPILKFFMFKDVPGCLASLGLMQRMYDGSLDIRISMSFIRLFLNWVAAWGWGMTHL